MVAKILSVQESATQVTYRVDDGTGAWLQMRTLAQTLTRNGALTPRPPPQASASSRCGSTSKHCCR